MSSYYDTILKRVESEMEKGDFAEAMKLLEEELSMPYIPKEDEERIITKYNLCRSELRAQEKPRRSTDFIISKAMRNNILGVGTIFLAVLLGMIYYFDHSAQGMDVHNLTIFFTFFVMLQFWNLFNARVFGTTDSAFKGLSKSYGMELIVLAILVGQFLIVQFGGAVFRTEPLDWQTWLLIIGVSSTVLWVGELVRLVQRIIHKKDRNEK